MAKKTPVQDSLYLRCFWIVAEECIKRGNETVEFSKVDELVLEKSKLSIIELKEFLEKSEK